MLLLAWEGLQNVSSKMGGGGELKRREGPAGRGLAQPRAQRWPPGARSAGGTGLRSAGRSSESRNTGRKIGALGGR